jgi:hypothetical protein
MEDKIKMVMILCGVVISLLVFLYFENNLITVTHINVESSKLPDGFDGYKIIHISDLHSKEFGWEQKHLVNIIKNEKPDSIAITGDLIDSRHYDIEPALSLVRQCTPIAPTFYVTGNHEGRRAVEFQTLEKLLVDSGVHVLRNTHAFVTKDEDKIYFVGIDDPAFNNPSYFEKAATTETQIIQALQGIQRPDTFKILLAHRPEMFSLYSSYGFDLVLSGHTHGGQVRLPFIGGLVAPGQGLFPKYTAGKYEQESSTMIVSRGLGNSIIPQRLFNRPEVVVLTLKNVLPPPNYRSCCTHTQKEALNKGLF